MELNNTNIVRILAQLYQIFPNCLIVRFQGKTNPQNGLMFVAKFNAAPDQDFMIVTPYGIAITGFQKIGIEHSFTLYVLDAEQFCQYYQIPTATYHEDVSGNTF